MKYMNKIFLFLLIILLSGCGKEKTITCSIDVENEMQNYVLTGTYEIYNDGKYVTKIHKQERYYSDDYSTLDYFEESKKLYYNNLNDLYGGFTFDVKKNKEYVNLDINIDLSYTNIKEMVKDQYIDKDYVLSNKLTVSGAKYYYMNKGAKCN